MPEKDPNFWTAVGAALLALQAFAYAAIVAIVRILRDDQETPWRRIALEMALCGLLAQGLHSGAHYFFGWEVPTLIAGAVGFFGPEWLRMKINRAVDRKIDKGDL